jgi:hypothetical protein
MHDAHHGHFITIHNEATLHGLLPASPTHSITATAIPLATPGDLQTGNISIYEKMIDHNMPKIAATTTAKVVRGPHLHRGL